MTQHWYGGMLLPLLITGMPVLPGRSPAPTHPPLASAIASQLAMIRASGTRCGTCLTDEPGSIGVVALVPARSFAVTTQAFPTVFVLIPTPPMAKKAVFQLIEGESLKDGKVIAQTTLALQGPGIMRLDLQKLTPRVPLEVDRDYRWAFGPICKSGKFELVSDPIRRVKLEPAVVRQLKTATLREQVEIYAGKGIWYEYLKALVDLKRQSPQDQEIQAGWQEAIKVMNLQYHLTGDTPFLGQSDPANQPALGVSAGPKCDVNTK